MVAQISITNKLTYNDQDNDRIDIALDAKSSDDSNEMEPMISASSYKDLTSPD